MNVEPIAIPAENCWVSGRLQVLQRLNIYNIVIVVECQFQVSDWLLGQFENVGQRIIFSSFRALSIFVNRIFIFDNVLIPKKFSASCRHLLEISGNTLEISVRLDGYLSFLLFKVLLFISIIIIPAKLSRKLIRCLGRCRYGCSKFWTRR